MMIFYKYDALSLFSILVLSSSWISLAMPQDKTTISVNVGVVLHTLECSMVGKVWLSCIQMAISDFYASPSHAHYKTRLVLKIQEYEKNDVVGAAAAALHLIKKENVQAIFGPVTSMETSFVINLGDRAHVPIISFSATSPSLTSLRSSYFFQFAQADSFQVAAIGDIVKAFGWRQVVPIYSDNSYGEGVIPFLTDALQDVGASIPYRCVISPSASDDKVESELYKLMTMQTRVFIIHMTDEDLVCSKLLARAKHIGMMSKGYVWITTNGITNSLSTMDSAVIKTMQGVLGVQSYVPSTKNLEDFKIRWKKKFKRENPTMSGAELNVFGLWAYDAVFAVAMAVEKVGITKTFDFQESNAPNILIDPETFRLSQVGPKLIRALLCSNFNGMAGEFRLVDGQRQSSTFEIVNENGDKARTIGYWKQHIGLLKTLKSASFDHELGPITWPGKSSDVPKGWEIPTNSKKLKIGVPLKDWFTEFVKVTIDQKKNTTYVTGFCIDVFTAAVNLLPYALPHEFIPYVNHDGTSAGTYNDLCYEVYLGKFDAVVGDMTIRANKSLHVDFTMPYTEVGVVMVVPVEVVGGENKWTFLKPWTWDLWLTTSCFFILIGFVVWVLEHRFNHDFRGPPLHQVGTGLWFSFSTMVFAQTASVVSNLARCVMAIWIFVVLVLTINYTANLTSLYTVQKLQKPTVNDLQDLLRNGDNVGYMQDAYVYDLLKQVGFHDSKLQGFGSMEDIDTALSKGTKKGGIAAVVDETPYMNLFLARYCNKYSMIGPIFKTGGFAFVFPKQSPLLPDVSEAILYMTRGGTILDIENKWFKKESNCQEDSSTPKVSSGSLGSDSFWVLFLIAGLASVIALIIFVTSFVYSHRHILMQRDGSESSTWRKVRAMFKIFNEKDLNCHTFKHNQLPDELDVHFAEPQLPRKSGPFEPRQEFCIL